jgi:hypothetical protein
MSSPTRQAFLDSLEDKRNEPAIRLDFSIRGEIKNKVITDLKRSGMPIGKHAQEVYKYYYDNHPDKMTY